ncbi:10255_t:CDS:2, partial [Entrophospora sp. SA101]
VYQELYNKAMSVEQLEKKINKLEADLDKYMVEPNEKESSQFFQFFGNQIALMNDVLFKYQKDESLTVHSYDPDVYEKYRRKFTMTKLVDLIELNLKNTNDYLQAIKTFIGLPEIQVYLYNNVIFIPADFPGQLYICRAIVKKLKNENETSIPEKITHLFPFLGPLHLALNTKESVFLTFWPFFDQLYRSIFNKKHKLAAKPKPWRIDTLMYLAHAGWELEDLWLKNSNSQKLHNM